MKTKLLTLILALLSFIIYSQNTSVPDDKFEEYLETHNANGDVVPLGDPASMGDGTLNNNSVPTAKINSVTTLDINGWGVYDLTGIEAFTALQIFDCHLNPISTMVLPPGNNLLELYCNNLDLTSLDVSSHTALTVLNCRFNNITTLNLSANNNITNLDCWGNPLGSLTVSNLLNLSILNCRETGLNTLDVSGNTALTVLDCQGNNLTSLNLSTNTAIISLFCSTNSGLTSLTLPNTSTLTRLECFSCSLPNLNVSNNTNLDDLRAQYNNLNALDLTNNTVLSYLNCQQNNITSLTLPASSNLYRIICDNNMIPSLNLDNNPGLTGLFCQFNNLTSLDLTNNPLLERLWCYNNDYLGFINFDNPVLWEVKSFNNPLLTNLNNTLSLTGLVDLYGWNCNLTTLDLTNCMVLEYAEPGDNPNLTNLTLPNTTTLNQLWAYGTNLSMVDYTNNTGLQKLDLGITKFTDIDVSMLPNLVEFWGNLNPQLTALNLKNGHNDILNKVRIQNNTSLTCIQVDNVAQAQAKPDWQEDDPSYYNTDCSLGFKEFDLSSVSIYPNPVNDKFYVNIQLKVDYTLSNYLGQEIRKGSLVSGTNELDTQSLASGLYLLKLETQEGSVTKKLIKE